MDFYSRMAGAVDYIEEHIEDDFDSSELAKIICCDFYQFGRIFSYVVGISVTEYVRNRRLSLAALDLSRGDGKVVDVALKYGYSSPESFARAFRDMHGLPPREAAVPGAKLKMYPRISFQISIKGEAEMEYKIVERDVIHGAGVVKNFGKYKINEQVENWTERMGEIWDLWDEFLNYDANLIIRDKYKLYKAPLWQMGVTHTDPDGNLTVFIGAEDNGGDYPELTKFEVPASTWAVFTAKGSLNKTEHPLNAVITRIFGEWLPSSGYEQSMNYQIQVYGPGDTGSDDYISEIWIPVRKK